MSREVLGDVLAYIPPGNAYNDKARYIKLGVAFKDDRGRISLKIDAMPVASAGWEGWEGWINILPSKFKSAALAEGEQVAAEGAAPPNNLNEADIPF